MDAYKANVINTVRLIADIDAQLEYEKNVPIANVPNELICQWFDDFYLSEFEWFKNKFTKKEWLVLEEFNDYYKKRLDNIPDTLEKMHKSYSWKEVVGKAQWVLEMLNWREIDAKYDDI